MARRWRAPLALIVGSFAPALVVGHGYQEAIQFGDGNRLTLWNARNVQDAKASVNDFTRQYNGDGPIYAFDQAQVSCNMLDNVPAKPATGYATAKAGDEVTLWMTQWVDGVAWLHYGPIEVYLASCNGDCTTFDSTTPNAWFKIYEAGFKNGKWAAQAMGENNSSFTFKLPETIKDGQYLLRPEILSLQFGKDPNGAQLFMACHQLTITGGKGCATPSGQYLASFPGSYDMKQPAFHTGIWTDEGQPNLNMSLTAYVPPGPPVFPDTCGGAVAAAGLIMTSMTPDGKSVTYEVPAKAGNNAAIIGGAVGGTVGLLGLLICLWCCCYRRRKEVECEEEQKKQLAIAAVIRRNRDSKKDAERDSASYAGTPAKVRPPTTPVYRTPSSEYAASKASYPGGGSYFNGTPYDASLYDANGIPYVTPPAYGDGQAYPASAYAASSAYAPSYTGAPTEYAAASSYAASSAAYATPPTEHAPSSVVGRSDYEYAPSTAVAPAPAPRRTKSSRSESSRRRDRERAPTERTGGSDRRPWTAARSVSATNAGESRYAASDAHYSSHPDGDDQSFYY